ncbi:hypothetical protein FV226_21765 [Methylobacterium sp. WL12]|uniref:hypothetical protein n=1 Tax=Methylobacterium sp. WL12 TaxID=2603890 RepID=UPI0011CC8E81|nr:hypothetical protein [Methylobacterium sp. WL12]TXM67462.1 hypothetical protein FV226_21765 [Methylobacterium sp. WL12]
MSDTPDPDRAARAIAENVYAAFCRVATMPAELLEEQTVLARLVEAIRPLVPTSSLGAIVEAANGALDAWEQRDADVHGPRVEEIDLGDGAVNMRANK